MTINDDKTVAAVAAPVTSKEVKEKIQSSKKPKQPIFDVPGSVLLMPIWLELLTK